MNVHDNDLFYIPELGIDGTIPELVRWANNYTDDYSSEALMKISELAKQCGYGEWEVNSPKLLLEERLRTDGYPYERMKLDLMESGKVSFSQSELDGTEIEVYSEGDKVIISVQGIEDECPFHAANVFSADEFKKGDSNWLQRKVNETLFYGKTYEMEDIEHE